MLVLLSLFVGLVVGWSSYQFIFVHKQNSIEILKHRVAKYDYPKRPTWEEIINVEKWKELTEEEKQTVKERWDSDKKGYPKRLEILYRANKAVPSKSVRIIVDCFKGKGRPTGGTYREVPIDEELYEGEIRIVEIGLPENISSFKLRLTENKQNKE